MAAPPGSILPASYFEGLSTLWGGCAYVGSAIVAAGLVFQALRTRPDASAFLWLFAKVALIGISTLFIREWLMRLNDIVFAFVDHFGIDPTQVDERFIEFLAGKTAAAPKTSVWDIIWNTPSIGTAVCYAFLWLFGWLSWGIQYIVKLIGGILLTAGWALSPLFLALFMLRPMAGVAQRYLVGLVALVCWPFGWALAAVVTNAMLDAAATARFVPVIVAGEAVAAPGLTVLLIGAWMIVSSILAPYVTTKVLLMGANPAAAFAGGLGEVGHAAFAGGVGAAAAAATGGATAAAVVGTAAAGALSAGSESAVRGGGPARTTGSAINGLSGLYASGHMRRQSAAMEHSAASQARRAAAAESMAAQVSSQMQKASRPRSRFAEQPHEDDPNKAVINIQTNEKSNP